MRMKTISSLEYNSQRNLSVSNTLYKKTPFPTIPSSPKKIKIYKNKHISIRNKKRKEDLSTNVSLVLRPKINSNVKMVNILNFEEDVDDILNTDLEIQRQKEKIDKNKTIKLIRLGLYKKKEKTEVENENIVEKEKENEEDLDKINTENRGKERKMEKKFKEKLGSLEQIREECQRLNAKINEVNKNLEDDVLESNVLVNYAKEFDEMYRQKLNEDKDKEKDLDESDEISGSESNRKNKKNKAFENLNKFILYKQHREDRKKFLQEDILIKESLKKKLESDLISKRIICNQEKKELYKIRKQLINSYHLKLYEGLDFHGESLVGIIKDIWNLGVNVNINFMPSYLDGEAIDFLFKKAHNSIELNKIRQVIKDNESELSYLIKDWRNNDKEANALLNKNSQILGLNKNKTDDNKNDLNENELFKTKVGDISLSYLEEYPKTKQFMIDYRRKHPYLFNKDIPGAEIKHIPFKSLNIPLKIMEKNKHLEKLKYLLEIKIEQNKQKDKKEVERLNKEFIKNGYKEKYEVNVETMFGALFGEEKKNEMLIYYSRLEKEYRDGKKIIQFHTKLKIK
jgi:hypothetical protein